MKKILLAAACVSLSMGAFADNLVVNGDFENTENLNRRIPWSWKGEQEMINTDDDSQPLGSIKGWTIHQNPWNIIVNIEGPEVDDEFIFEGNKQCLFMTRFDDNGWDWGGVEQAVTGLKVGQKYTFGCLVAYREGTTVDWDDAQHGVKITPCNADGSDAVGDAILEENYLDCADYFQHYRFDFVATTPAVKIRLFHTNYVAEGNHSEGFWQRFDNVMLCTPEEYETYLENLGDEHPNLDWMSDPEGIEFVDGVEDNEILGIYDLNGVEMGNSLEGKKGIFVVRTGKGAKKVVLY